MDKRISDIKDKFLALEKSFNLFELEIIGIKIWQYLRFDIYSQIVSKHSDFTDFRKNVKELKGLLIMGIISLRSILVKNPLLGKKKEILVFTQERRKKMYGEYYDIYTDFLMDTEKFDFQAIGIFSKGTHLKPARTKNLKYFDFPLLLCYFYMLFTKIKFSNEELQKIKKIEKILKKKFKLKINLINLIKEKLKFRRSLLWIFQKILKIYKPKIIIEVCYYSTIKMALNELCKEKGIKTIEFQHGTVSSYNIGYQFPNNVEVKVFPDYFFSFGDYWNNIMSLPIDKSHIKSVGFPYFENMIRKYSNNNNIKDKILFISQWTIGQKLSSLALKIAEKLEKYEIIYKLHPMEFENWKINYPELKDNKKITVITNEIPLYQLFNESFVQIGVYSTGLFEGLMFRLKTLIYKIPGYEFFQDLIDKKYVHLIENFSDFKEFLKNSIETINLNYQNMLRRNSLSNQISAIKEVIEEDY